MQNKKLSFIAIFLSVCFLFIGTPKGLTQGKNKSKEQKSVIPSFEDIFIHWYFALDKVRIHAGIPHDEFDVFTRFSQHAIDSLRADFMKRIDDKTVTASNVGKYELVIENAVMALFGNYENIKKMYPSSVDEFREYKEPYLTAVCDSACNNIDFENGTLSGWNAYYGLNNSGTTATTIVLINGGPAGAVTHAANDTLTSTPGYYNSGSVGANPSPDYQVNITSGSLHDALIPSLPEVSPFGGHYSVMLGDSTQVNYGVAILSQTFLVGASNANFTYQYAVVLANPVHNYYQQPLFKVAVLDASGDTIPFCGEYNVVSGHGTSNFDSIYDHVTYPLGDTSSFWVFYKNWTIVNVPLTHYIGQCVTIVFEAVDCSLGGHFGYAYVDASCSPMAVLSSSQNFCGQDSITLTGPAGEGHYLWTGPTGGIISNDTLSSVNIDSSGTYTLVVTPFTGATCDDTLTVNIGRRTGPPPHPDFSADTGCAGLSTAFFNSSNPLGGANFYWDFYNSGIYEDSATNPVWIYNTPGIYTVKLHEVYNGCGMDTTINIVVDTTVSSSFFADTVCFRDTTQFTNTSSGGKTYYWNFGDTASRSSNTSALFNPSHTFSAPGIYSVLLVGKHPGWCNDSIKGSVLVLTLPKATITGSDSICLGSSDILTAGGGSSFLWNNGSTTSSITVTPSAPTSYSVQVSNGICVGDTTFNVFIKPVLSGTLSGNNTCAGDSIHLDASGGGTYLWNTGATTSSINVLAGFNSDTTYSVTISNGGSCITVNKSITIYPLPKVIICCDTTIAPGASTTLFGSGGNSYYWLPLTGLSCDTCPDPTVSPTSTTTYTLITTDSNHCSIESEVTVDVVIPCLDFVVPNVFSPNGDSKNDTYYIKVEFMAKYVISIYNRWGQEVYTSENPENPWNGLVEGLPAPAGVYYYIIRATCFDGNSFVKHGFVQLIR